MFIQNILLFHYFRLYNCNGQKHRQIMLNSLKNYFLAEKVPEDTGMYMYQ